METSTAAIATSAAGYFLNADDNAVTTAGTVVPATAAAAAAASNCYNAPTNVKMTLADARTELQEQGFVILEPHEQQEVLSSSSSSSSNMLVGCRSECRWHMLAKLDTLVFCQAMDPAVSLTVGRIQDDVQRLKTEWLLSLPPSFYSPSGCPPHGASRGRMILMIYLTQQPISSEVAWYLTQQPPGEWCQTTFLAAQDGASSNGHVTSYFYSQETPLWGRALYPEVRYWAALLTGRRPLPDKPSPYNWRLIAINVYCLVLLYVMHPPNTPSGRKVWLLFLAIVLGMSLVAFVYHECQIRQQRRQRAVVANNDNTATTTTGASATTKMGESLV